MSATDRDREIAELHDALVAKAKEQAEMEGTERKVLEAADQATLDQQLATIKAHAKIVATYYSELVTNGVTDTWDAAWMARDLADYMRSGEE